MCSCHSILECCVTFSGVKLSIRSLVLLLLHICMSVGYNSDLHLTYLLTGISDVGMAVSS